jgi:hypothetical protein
MFGHSLKGQESNRRSHPGYVAYKLLLVMKTAHSVTDAVDVDTHDAL